MGRDARKKPKKTVARRRKINFLGTESLSLWLKLAIFHYCFFIQDFGKYWKYGPIYEPILNPCEFLAYVRSFQ